ncbi:unnamed protein product [Orchesella dallaii]|uniref:Uncharacterized protein n=1 Tax=Orchesella dallaii TaxID=48710 RepID=A0ABP1RMW0_9HEXA
MEGEQDSEGMFQYIDVSEVYPRVVMERDALNQQIQRRDVSIQEITQQRDALIHGMQQGDAFIQELQRQRHALNVELQLRDKLIQEMKERELLNYRIISDLEDQKKFQINQDVKLEAMQTANTSMKKERDEYKEKYEELKRQLEQKCAHDSPQEEIANLLQLPQQVDTNVPSSTLIDEEDAAVDSSGGNAVLSPDSSSVGPLSSISESYGKRDELNDLQKPARLSATAGKGEVAVAGGKPTIKPFLIRKLISTPFQYVGILACCIKRRMQELLTIPAPKRARTLSSVVASL